MDEYKLKFTFLRHGVGCHNILNTLIKIGKKNDRNIYFKDSILSDIGVEESYNNAKNFIYDYDIIYCSGLLRSMETAYFMAKAINYNKKIYVLPYLREIDEGSDNIYSKESIERINTIPNYSMKSLEYQKKYLQDLGILDRFEFKFIEEHDRKSPGNIKNFISWIYLYTPGFTSFNKNILVITHAGVLKYYTDTGFKNNSGFNIVVKFYKKHFLFSKPDFDIYKKKLYKSNQNINYCSSSRCKELCNI